jgi:hypothetical protein
VRTQRRTSLIAAVAVTLVVLLPLMQPASAQERPAARDHGIGHTHAEAKRILDRVRAALQPKSGAERRASLARRDLTLQLRDLRLARAALTRSERAVADSYLARPALSSACTGTVAISGHFCVHYSTGLLAGADAATPEQAQLTADTFTNVWSREVVAMGFRAPPTDGDEYFDVYLQDVGADGYYGYCAPDHNAAHSSSYCVLDNDFDPAQFGAPAINSLRVTAAHEFFHAIQFGYDTGEDIWFMEGTAVWAEEQVYPKINDYLQYLDYSAITRPRTPADYGGVDGTRDIFFRYGAVLFWKFLSQRFGTTKVVRRVWEYADTSAGSRYSLQAIAAAVAERGWSFRRTFGVFGAWNTLPVTSYDDRGLYPAPAWWRSDRLTRSHRSTGGLGVTLDHLTNAALTLRPGKKLPKSTRIRIKVNAPSSVRMPYAVVQVRKRDGTVSFVSVPLDSNGDGGKGVTFNPRLVSRVVVTLTDASIRMTGCGTDDADRFACGGFGVDDDLSFYVSARLRHL